VRKAESSAAAIFALASIFVATKADAPKSAPLGTPVIFNGVPLPGGVYWQLADDGKTVVAADSTYHIQGTKPFVDADSYLDALEDNVLSDPDIAGAEIDLNSDNTAPVLSLDVISGTDQKALCAKLPQSFLADGHCRIQLPKPNSMAVVFNQVTGPEMGSMVVGGTAPLPLPSNTLIIPSR